MIKEGRRSTVEEEKEPRLQSRRRWLVGVPEWKLSGRDWAVNKVV